MHVSQPLKDLMVLGVIRKWLYIWQMINLASRFSGSQIALMANNESFTNHAAEVVDVGRWTLDGERRTVGGGRWPVNGGRRVVDCGRRCAARHQAAGPQIPEVLSGYSCGKSILVFRMFSSRSLFLSCCLEERLNILKFPYGFPASSIIPLLPIDASHGTDNEAWENPVT